MNKLFYTLDIIVLLLIPIAFIVTPIEKKEAKCISTSIASKYLPSKNVNKVEVVNENVTANEINLKVLEETEVLKTSVKENEETVSKDVSEPVPVSDVLESQTGSMSGYGPDCKGCSGNLASGKYVGDGTIYVNDSTYGNVRILAGDKSYPFGTIVRVKNTRAGDFIGIVLDRGGSIGFGKRFLFDLLYPTENLASNDQVSYGAIFEILRYGY